MLRFAHFCVSVRARKYDLFLGSLGCVGTAGRFDKQLLDGVITCFVDRPSIDLGKGRGWLSRIEIRVLKRSFVLFPSLLDGRC